MIRLAAIFLLAATAQLDHSAWDQLLKEYVTPESRVDYQRWKDRGVAKLDGYLSQFAKPWPAQLSPAAKKAALINAYNALAIRWIIEHYPVESIWRTPDPFDKARHRIDGRKVSLDEIETELRDMGGPRIHAAVVCAARSCPPLRREAYTASRVDQQLTANTRAWLANPELNEFLPEKKTARVSRIFSWYDSDFDSLANFLATYGPPSKTGFLDDPDAKIEFKSYHWGLNDTSTLGDDYSRLEFFWDRIWKGL